jgi:simple sugar transport system permease protein
VQPDAHTPPAPAPAAPASEPGQQGAARSRRSWLSWRVFAEQRELTPTLITIGLFVYFTAHSGSEFLSSLSLSSAAGYAGPIGAIAVGEVLLLMLAEIDLSAGQVFLFAPWVMYWFAGLGVPSGLAVVIALLVVCGVGAINGLITVRLNVPSFVTTLAMNFILYGLVLIYSNDTEATPIPLAVPPTTTATAAPVHFYSQILGVWQWSEAVWVVALGVLAHLMLRRTRFGVRIVATGGNLLGAAEAGVPVRRVKVWSFVLCSLLSGLVGIVDAIKYGSLDPGNLGVNYILYAVGACVIGGTALTGGRGTVIGALIGAILIGVLEDGLTLIGVSTNDFYVWVGVVIIVAMALNVQLDRFVARTRAG